MFVSSLESGSSGCINTTIATVVICSLVQDDWPTHAAKAKREAAASWTHEIAHGMLYMQVCIKHYWASGCCESPLLLLLLLQNYISPKYFIGDFLIPALDLFLDFATKNVMRRIPAALTVRSLGGNAMGNPRFNRQGGRVRSMAAVKARVQKDRGTLRNWS